MKRVLLFPLKRVPTLLEALGEKQKNGQRMKVVTMNSGTLLALVLKVRSNLLALSLLRIVHELVNFLVYPNYPIEINILAFYLLKLR